MQGSPITSVLSLDDRAVFTQHAPDPRLHGLVESFWTLTIDEPPARLRIVPDGRVDLVFDVLNGEAYFSGVNSKPFDVDHDRPVRFLGVTMTSPSAAAFLGTDLGALGASWRPLGSVMGPIGEVLVDYIMDTQTVAAGIAAIEAALIARLGPADARVAKASGMIAQSAGAIDIAGVGPSSGMSPRNLRRLFNRWLALSPKAFARICRVQEVLRHIQNFPDASLKAVAADFGFSDQAHLSREIRAITGLTPSRLAELFKRQSETFKL